MRETYRVETDYPTSEVLPDNTVTDHCRDEFFALQTSRLLRAGSALPNWIEMRTIRTRGDRDDVIEHYWREPKAPTSRESAFDRARRAERRAALWLWVRRVCWFGGAILMGLLAGLEISK